MLKLNVLQREGGAPKVGVIAGRTVGGAVARNRAKRVLRAGIQPWLPLVKPDVELVLVARPAIREANSTEVTKVLERLLLKAQVLKKV